MPYSRNIHRYEPPPIYKKVMETLLEMNKRMDTIQTDLKLIKKIVSIEKDFVLVNDDNQMELDMDMPVR
jgi:hypothetical protein